MRLGQKSKVSSQEFTTGIRRMRGQAKAKDASAKRPELQGHPMFVSQMLCMKCWQFSLISLIMFDIHDLPWGSYGIR